MAKAKHNDGPESGALQIRARADILAAAGDAPDSLPRFDIVAYTGVPLNQGAMGWYEQVVVDQEGWVLGDGTFPILDEHGGSPMRLDAKTLKDFVVGQSDYAKVEGSGDKAVLRLKGGMTDVNECGKQIIKLAKTPIPASDPSKPPQKYSFQASIGARVVQKEYVPDDTEVVVNGTTYTGPLFIARKTVLRELSICVLGDDKNTETVIARISPMPKNLRADGQTFEAYCKSEYDTDPKDMTEKMKAKVKAEYEDKDDDDDADKTNAKASDSDDKTDAKAKVKADGQGKDDDSNTDQTQAAALLNLRSTVADEMVRINRIRDICAGAPTLTTEIRVGKDKKPVVILEHAIKAGWDAEQTENAFALAELRAGRPNSTPFFYSPSQPIMNEAVIEAALLEASRCQLQSDEFYSDRKANGQWERRVSSDVQASTQKEMKDRYPDQVLQAAHTHFGKYGITLHQMLLTIAASNGYKGRHKVDQFNLLEILQCAFNSGMGRIRADGGSAVSAPNVFANVLNKKLLEGYLSVNQSWREISSIIPTQDFKPVKNINIFGDFVFKKLNADGQITNAAMTDQAFANQVDTFARKLSLNRQQLINDDTNALTTVPKLLGIGSSDAISILVWTLWLQSVTSINGDDGTTFWNASRAGTVNQLGGGAGNPNKITGGSSAASSASLQLAAQLFDKQVKPNGQPLGVEPAVLVYPPELDQVFWELLYSERTVYGGSTASRQPDKNKWFGRFRGVKVPYLSNSQYTNNSTTAWWLLADPKRTEAIQVAFLNGQETPTVMTVQLGNLGNELGVTTLGYHDFGAAMQNFRAGVMSAGA
jgi:hypothetical protein